MSHRHLLVAAATTCAVLSGCHGIAEIRPVDAASGPPDASARQVTILNPGRHTLLFRHAERDGWSATRPLGNHDTYELRLPPGRYALCVDTDAPRIPLPLPVAELGFAPPPSTVLTIEPWPAAEAGWCWIPAGIGLRGDDLGVGQEDERPVATPMLAAFWLASCETTNEQYVRFLNAIGQDQIDRAWLDLEGTKCRIDWDEGTGTFTTDAPDLPVVTVSWLGAVAYCEWRTEATGVVHRLPTETEWEKAARGPGSRVYAYGDTCRTDAANQESGRLREVGRYEPNGFGLCDMTANAFEWCADAYARRAYDGESAAATPDVFRVLRGGSFVLDGIFCRNSMRMRLRADVRADDVGFRVLREADGAAGERQ